MEARYYLHRINNAPEASYSLLEKGFLTLGWESFADTRILDAARADGYPDFDIITKEKGENKNRSRWNMWYFARMDSGDTVVVPLYGGCFSVYRICGRAKPIADLEKSISSISGKWNKHTIVWKDHRLFDDEGKLDLGFFVQVEPVVENVPRRIVAGALISRMKIRTTTADITDIKEFVDAAVIAGRENKPITLYEEAINSLAKELQKKIQKTLDDSKFEQLIKWYMIKIGASSAWIPSKNERGKKDGADADVIADYEHLRFLVYVQAKHHTGETDEWAVRQVSSYKIQKGEDVPDYTYATWVITSADKFSQGAIRMAKELGVRLINGMDFAQMLLNVGLLDINEAFTGLLAIKRDI